MIQKLSRHLESALGRLNRVQSPVNETTPTLVALSSAKARLEAQNNLLRAKQDELNSQIAELSRKKQILDLENRQLFQALNGRPSSDTDVRTAKKSAHDNKRLVFGD